MTWNLLSRSRATVITKIRWLITFHEFLEWLKYFENSGLWMVICKFQVLRGLSLNMIRICKISEVQIFTPHNNDIATLMLLNQRNGEEVAQQGTKSLES
ncbi:hypothetical protein D0Y65_003262 [Glycine soja]|nr:hypothetical protein D0Y65_003262 [Glycine soja]